MSTSGRTWVDRPDLTGIDQVERALDRRQRRAQFVADHGDELRFDHQRGLRALVFDLQFGDVVEVLAVKAQETQRAIDQEIDHHHDGEELQPQIR
jgi:hypothetical protein